MHYIPGLKPNNQNTEVLSSRKCHESLLAQMLPVQKSKLERLQQKNNNDKRDFAQQMLIKVEIGFQRPSLFNDGQRKL